MSANVQEEERPSVSETPMPRYTLQLEPPIGTCFWSVQDIPIFTKKIVQSKESDQHILITWSCQCYISTTNQTPDSGNFAESAHDETFKLRVTAASGSPLTHLPNYSMKDGDYSFSQRHNPNRIHRIHTMNM